MKDHREELTLVLVRRNQEVLLGIKKTGFGTGRWNSLGGRLEEGESPLEGALRELREECGLVAQEGKQVALLEVDYEHLGRKIRIHVFEVTEFTGDLVATEEMDVKWIPVEQVPYERMWPNDIYWLPLVFNHKIIKAYFLFRGEQAIETMKVEEVRELP